VHVSSFVTPNDFPLLFTRQGGVVALEKTLAQSYTPQPNYWTLYSRLRGPYGTLLATDTFPDGTPYTMPPSACAWWGHCNGIVRDRLQTQAAQMRACIKPRGRRAEQTTFDVSCPAPTLRCGS